MKRRFFFIAFFLLGFSELFAQAKWFVTEDLRPAWMIFSGNQYVPFDDKNEKTIYVRLDAAGNQGKYLSITSEKEWSLFINGKMKGTYRSKSKMLSIDSLRREFHTADLLVAIHKEKINGKNLLTQIVSQTNAADNTAIAQIPRPETYFRDFVIVGAIVLLILLIVMNQLTKLNLSYFSVKRLFSSSESDEAQLHPRITSGSNVLYCIFCSLILSFYLNIIFHFTADRFDIAWTYASSSFGSAFWQWMKLSMIVLLVFVIKIILVFAMSRLFGLRELFGFQILNWIKILMVTFGIVNIILIVYFISRGTNPEVYITLFWAIVFVLSAWLIILFTKVARRAGHSLFHIFSYLCATEIIPLLISIKLLYH